MEILALAMKIMKQASYFSLLASTTFARLALPNLLSLAPKSK
jgi:hypothetical protein